MKNVVYFLKRFLLPHIKLFILVLFTGVVASAASGLGVPLLVKYIFPVVFHTAGDEHTERNSGKQGVRVPEEEIHGHRYDSDG